jgi:hypothetical protein
MKNDFYERILAKEGVEFEYIPDFSLERIDKNKSLRNQARLQNPIDEELVTAYRNEEGDEFPPLVTWRPTPRSRDILVDGNNRLEAFDRNGKKLHDILRVASVDSKVIDRITWTFNSRINGKRNSYEDMLEHAVSYYRKHGGVVKEIAGIWGVNYTTLNQRISIAAGRDILEKKNIKSVGFAEDVLLRLNPLLEIDENLFCDSVFVITSSGLVGNDAADLMRDIKKAKTIEKKRACVEKLATSEKATLRRAETKGGKIAVKRRGPRELFCDYNKKLRNLTDDYEMSVLLPMGHEYKEHREYAKDIVRRLTLGFGLGVVPHDARIEE